MTFSRSLLCASLVALTAQAHALCVINATPNGAGAQASIEIAGSAPLQLDSKWYAQAGNTCVTRANTPRDTTPVTFKVTYTMPPSPGCTSGGCPIVCGPVTVAQSTFVLINTAAFSTPYAYMVWDASGAVPKTGANGPDFRNTPRGERQLCQSNQ